MPDYDSEVKKRLSDALETLASYEFDADRQADFEAYISVLRKLSSETDEQYKKDRYGLHKKFTQTDLEKFLSIYSLCGTAGEKLLASMDKSDPFYGTVLNIQQLIAKDYTVLNAVDKNSLADGTVSLQKIIDSARMRTVDISGYDLGKVGNAMSSRIPFNLVEADGKELPGVFTPKKKVDIIGGYEAMIGNITSKYPELAKYLNIYRDGAKAFISKGLVKSGINPAEFPECDYILNAMLMLYDNNSGKITTQSLLQAFKYAIPNDFDNFKDSIQTVDGDKGIREFTKEVDDFNNAACINLKEAGIEDGSRVDGRNSAMSAVADLLGVSNLICRAVPMTVTKDGEKVEGTFMGLAEGVDIYAPTDASLHYSGRTDVFNNSNGLKDLADLQVIDFICGNVDRHVANMFYKFDTSDPIPENHKFVGVQGIDNDASFGTFVPKDSKDCVMKFTSLDNLHVMSVSMADKILKLEPEMLTLVLRNHGLEDAQIKAAEARLNMLKDYIQKSKDHYDNLDALEKTILDSEPDLVDDGTVRFVEDDQFCRLNLREIARPSGKGTNAFTNAAYFHKEACRSASKSIKTDPLKPKKLEPIKAVIMSDKEVARAQAWVKSVADATNWRGSSKQFDAFSAAVIKYKEFCESNKGLVLSEDIYKIRRDMLKDIARKSKAYIDNKKKVANPNDYTQNRIDVARGIGVEAGLECLSDGYEEIQKNMTTDEKKRYADGLHEYEERAINEFNAKMRKAVEEINKTKIRQKNEPAEEKTI